MKGEELAQYRPFVTQLKMDAAVTGRLYRCRQRRLNVLRFRPLTPYDKWDGEWLTDTVARLPPQYNSRSTASSRLFDGCNGFRPACNFS